MLLFLLFFTILLFLHLISILLRILLLCTSFITTPCLLLLLSLLIFLGLLHQLLQHFFYLFCPLRLSSPTLPCSDSQNRALEALC